MSQGQQEESRVTLVRAAADEWRRSLLNISGGNRLLYYRELRVGTLGLARASADAVERLLAHHPVGLDRMFPASLDQVGAVKSLRAITAGARMAAEEFGIHLTYLASGFASWEVNASEPRAFDKDAGDGANRSPRSPNAPVLLRQLHIVPRPGSTAGYELTVQGEPQVNPVLLHVLRGHGVLVDEVALLEGADRDQILFKALTQQCREAMPSFTIQPSRVIGNFTYAERPLVEDLAEGSAEFLAASDVVAALAGDKGAELAVRNLGAPVSIETPDLRPPSDEFLILDADGSQAYVINAVVAGQNLVVQGPPGTGKSQTIANVIAELIAGGQTVLFVAQKRAAIQAVLDRLERCDLSHLVLDLFTAGASRKGVIAEINQAMQRRSEIPRPRTEALHADLVDNRDRLVASHAAMHEARMPWNLTLAGTRHPAPVEGLLDMAVRTSSHANSHVRLDWDKIIQWDESTLDRMCSAIEDFVALGGTAEGLTGSGWTPSALRTSDIVAAAHAHAARLRDSLQGAPAALRALADETGGRPPSTVSDVDAMVEVASAANDIFVRGLGYAFSREVAFDELRVWALSFAGRASRKTAGLALGFWERRSVARRVRAAFPAVVGDAELSVGLLDACAVRARLIEAGLRVPEKPFAASAEAHDLWKSVRETISELTPFVRGLDFPDRREISDIADLVESLVEDRSHWHYPQVNEAHLSLVQAGCEPVVQDLFKVKPKSPVEAADRLTRAFAMTVIERIERTDNRLIGMTGRVRDRAAERFSAADAMTRSLNSKRIARAAAERLGAVLDTHADQSQILTAQMKRKRGFLPVRSLVSQAPAVLLAAKPVWAASPQQVSELLPRERLFDVVVFDEASQIQPAAALPAIARGTQVVVAGDSLQLPPTTLFTKTLDGQAGLPAGTNDEDEAPDSEVGLVIQDMESILDAVETKIGTQRSRHLAWHYRSRDERLIATSNRWVYEPVGRHLTTFPATDGATSLRHVVVPWSRGLGATNLSPRGEVVAVVDLVLDHARSDPGHSLGVIAFGQKHAQRLQEELDRRLQNERESVRDWFDPETPEPFFIKNIERVQGDERSKIILTVGYAKGDDQRLRYNWGPVLQPGGQRRVNVAITRARRDLVLVTSFHPSDIDERASDAEGFQLMRRFIAFANSEGHTFGDEGGRSIPLNPFEDDIRRRLEGAGLDVTPQYGVGRYRIDFAVRHPKHPGRFVLAVEADGASYHSGSIARERDRLRREALEERGWKFVRIWSTDYFHDPEAQVRRVLDAYHSALAQRRTSRPHKPEVVAQATARSPAQPIPRRGPKPTFHPGRPIASYSDHELDSVVRWVTSDGLVYTSDEIYEAVKSELGFRRNGSNIVSRIRAAVERAR